MNSTCHIHSPFLEKLSHAEMYALDFFLVKLSGCFFILIFLRKQLAASIFLFGHKISFFRNI